MLRVERPEHAMGVYWDSRCVVGYVDGLDRRKPYLHPLALPDGTVLTTDSPEDHPHHHGAWFAHHLVQAGAETWDFYLERGRANEGRQVHRGVDRVVGTGERVGFRASHDWLAPDGQRVARSAWDIRVCATAAKSGPMVVVDWAIVLAADSSTLVLQPTNESAMPLIRPAEGLAPRGGGLLRNSRGQRNERETFGRQAEWVDCSGEALVLPPWRPLLVRYRLLLHHGDAEEAGVQERWQEYVADAVLGVGNAGAAPPRRPEPWPSDRRRNA